MAPFLSVLAALLLLAAPAAAGVPPCSDGSCVPGGGDPATDCFAEFEGVHLNSPFPVPGDPSPEPKTALRCFDGDAGCDLDGEANGRCRFPLDICLFNSDPNLATCTPAMVSEVKITAKKAKKLGPLKKAVKALVPAGAAACTDGGALEVALSGGRKDQARTVDVEVQAETASGQDLDTLTLTCLPRLWPSHGYDSYNRRNAPRTRLKPKNVSKLAIKWTHDTQGGVTSTPTVSESRVYATSWDGVLYALDRETGIPDWDYDTGSASSGGLQSSATLTPDGRVLIGDSAAMVHCLDAETGDPLWTKSVEILPQDHIWGSPTVANNRVLVPVASDGDDPCTKGRVQALDLDTGDPLWTARTAPDRVCEDDTTVGCTLDGDCPTGRCVGMCAGDRGIACVDDLECGTDAPCEDAIGGGVTATPALDPTGETMFMASVGCYTGPRIGNADRIFRVRASDGMIEWAMPDFPPEPFSDTPFFNDYGFLNGPIVVQGETPFLVGASKDGKVYAVDAATGAEVWTHTAGDVSAAQDAFAGFGLFNGPAALAKGRLFTSLNAFGDGTPADVIHTQAFDVETGDPAWSADFDIGPTWGAVSVAGDVVFVGKGNLGLGTPAFYAFDAKKGKRLATFDLPAQSTSGPSIVGSEVFVGFGVLGVTGGVRAYELP